MMKKTNKKYWIAMVGFLLGVIFYLFGAMVSNAEVSAIAPTLSELVRNINYSALFIYGIIGFIMMFVLIRLAYKFGK